MASLITAMFPGSESAASLDEHEREKPSLCAGLHDRLRPEMLQVCACRSGHCRAPGRAACVRSRSTAAARHTNARTSLPTEMLCFPRHQDKAPTLGTQVSVCLLDVINMSHLLNSYCYKGEIVPDTFPFQFMHHLIKHVV